MSGLRFYRRLKLLPGITLNVSKSGISTSVGVRGAHVTIGPHGTRETVGIPGTGLSYTHVDGAHKTAVEAPGAVPAPAVTQPSPPLPKGVVWRGYLWMLLLVALAALAVWRSTHGG